MARLSPMCSVVTGMHLLKAPGALMMSEKKNRFHMCSNLQHAQGHGFLSTGIPQATFNVEFFDLSTLAHMELATVKS